MRYSFSGHESFLCKAMWLKKGYDFIQANNKYSDPDAVVKLGVGKNMVQSIKYWMKAFSLMNNDQLTTLAHYLFSDANGKDPYAEDPNTLWILHYMLVKSGIASLYKLVFLDFQREKKVFDKDQLLLFVKRKCNAPEQKNVYNENTVKKDIRVLLQNYIAPENVKSLDEYSGLLLSLGLLRKNGNMYFFNETSKKQIDALIILYALVTIAGEDKTVSYDKLQELSLVFCMSQSSFLRCLRELAEAYPKELVYTDNSGIRNVQFLQNLNAMNILNKYYDKRK